MRAIAPVKFTRTRADETSLNATLEPAQVVRAIREYVAREAGLQVDDPAVYISVNCTDGSPVKPVAVAILIDHTKQPVAAG